MTIKELLLGSDTLSDKQENMRELVMYPVAGIFTALANFLSFVIMDMVLSESAPADIMGYVFDLSLILKQFVSWVATILTAYATNRIFVFRSHGNFFLELLGFAAARLSTFVVIELALFSLMVYWMENHLGIDQHRLIFAILGFNCTCLYVVKVLNNLVLILMNFILSKWLVFKASNKHKSSDEVIDDVR